MTSVYYLFHLQAIQIQGVVGRGNTGDIAIDDIKIKQSCDHGKQSYGDMLHQPNLWELKHS